MKMGPKQKMQKVWFLSKLRGDEIIPLEIMGKEYFRNQ